MFMGADCGWVCVEPPSICSGMFIGSCIGGAAAEALGGKLGSIVNALDAGVAFASWAPGFAGSFSEFGRD